MSFLATHRPPTTPLLPTAARESVEDFVENSPVVALREAWKALRSPRIEGVVWHRSSDSPLMEISQALRSVAQSLPHGDFWSSHVTTSSSENTIRELITRSGIPDALGAKGSRAADILAAELEAMYSGAMRMTRANEGAISIRVEKTAPQELHFHRDYGTSIFTSLVGPGTLFTTSENVPPTNRGALSSSQLLRQENIFTTPTGSSLIVRGVSPRSSADFNPVGKRQGLWHASPATEQFGDSIQPLRVLLIVATPSHKIAPVTPSFSAWQ